jgi:hypothetical protein
MVTPPKHGHGHGHGHKDDSDIDPKVAKIDHRRISGMAFEIAKSGVTSQVFEGYTSDKVAAFCIDVATRIEKARIDGDIDIDADRE